MLKSFTVTVTRSPNAARQPVRTPGELSESRKNACTALNSVPDWGAESCRLSSTEPFKTLRPSKTTQPVCESSNKKSTLELVDWLINAEGYKEPRCHRRYAITLNPELFNRRCLPLCRWMVGSVWIKKWQQMPFGAFVKPGLIKKNKQKNNLKVHKFGWHLMWIENRKMQNKKKKPLHSSRHFISDLQLALVMEAVLISRAENDDKMAYLNWNRVKVENIGFERHGTCHYKFVVFLLWLFTSPKPFLIIGIDTQSHFNKNKYAQFLWYTFDRDTIKY